jgi:signal transduction histidine kinase
MSAASQVEQAINASQLDKLELTDLLDKLVAAYNDIYPDTRFDLKLADSKQTIFINGSEELLVQMLDKLIDNAQDFSQPEKHVVIELSDVDERKSAVILSVSNPGPHLPEAMAQEIFDSMVSVRAKQSNPETHHLGLGLHIARLIVEHHSGELGARNLSKRDHDAFDGVVFSVSLPVERAE